VRAIGHLDVRFERADNGGLSRNRRSGARTMAIESPTNPKEARATCRLVAALVLLACRLPGAQGAEPPQSRLLVVGHRGLMQQAPENTLAGFRACLALRVGFEFDVARTRDGQLVCLHDATLDRTTDGQGKLSDRTASEVHRFDAGARFDPAFRGERVPAIDEIFALLAAEARGETLIAVDMKATGEGIEEQVVRLAEQRKVLDRLLFIGATIQSAEVRSRLHATSRHARTARLATEASEIDAVLADDQADWVYVRFLPTPGAVERIHRAGKRVFLAGPLVAGKELAHWREAATVGIDGVLTDFPLELMRQLRN
jgi:glycerophosphoryl diester phosphodiesterase